MNIFSFSRLLDKKTFYRTARKGIIGDMHSLTAKDFFSFESVEHRDLWQEEEFVWQALSRMEEYFQKFSFSQKKPVVPPNVYLDLSEQIFIGEGDDFGARRLYSGAVHSGVGVHCPPWCIFARRRDLREKLCDRPCARRSSIPFF